MVDINDPWLIVMAVVVPIILIVINYLFVYHYIEMPPYGARSWTDYLSVAVLVSLCNVPLGSPLAIMA